MEVHEIGYFDAPLEQVFRAMRDDFDRYLAELPIVSSARTLEAEENGPAQMITAVEWEMAPSMPVAPQPGGAPAADAKKWHFYALWSQERWTCEWRLQSLLLPESVHVFGTLRFDQEAKRTKCSLVAMVNFDMDSPEAESKMEAYLMRYMLTRDFMMNEKALGKLVSA